MRSPSELSADPAAVLKKALAELDPGGRLSRDGARRVRQCLRRMRGEGISFARWEPGDLLGPFEQLTEAGQKAVVRTIKTAERWRLQARQLGKWQPWITRAFGSREFRRVAGRFAPVLQAVVRSGPRSFLSGAHRAWLTWQGKAFPRPTLAAVLHRGGMKPWSLGNCYARALPQPVGYRGFWHDPDRHVTVGSVFGIDLLPSSQGFWFIENNLDSGLLLERTAIYERDPFVLNLLDSAAAGGYRHVVLLPPNFCAIDDVMARQLREEAAARKIRLTILEDVFLPEARRPRGDRVPVPESGDMLVARMRLFRTNLDYLFHHKVEGYRALRAYREKTGDTRFLLPKTSPDPELNASDADGPFPNVVYKLAQRDSGMGVFFLKATSPEHARSITADAVRGGDPPSSLTDRLYARVEEHEGLYQPYIRGSLLEGRRLYKIRVNVLATPIGSRFLSAHRVVSSYPVPEELPAGVVRDRAPYLLNYCAGAGITTVPADEESRAVKAALAVARGFSWAAEYGFQHSPNDFLAIAGEGVNA